MFSPLVPHIHFTAQGLEAAVPSCMAVAALQEHMTAELVELGGNETLTLSRIELTALDVATGMRQDEVWDEELATLAASLGIAIPTSPQCDAETGFECQSFDPPQFVPDTTEVRVEPESGEVWS